MCSDTNIQTTMSLSEEYEHILSVISNDINRTQLRQDSTDFQTILTSTIVKLLNLKTTVYSKLALFSSNELLEDATTSSLKFLSIDYNLALLCSKKQVTDTQVNDRLSKNKMKVKFLEKSVQLYIQFLVSLQDYEILDSLLVKKIDSFEETYTPTISELYTEPSSGEDLNGAQLRRQQKIEVFKKNKEIEEQLLFLELKYKSFEDDAIDDDETLRDLYIQKLKRLSFKAFSEMEQILYEKELLNNFINDPVHEIINDEEVKKDNKPEDNSYPTKYTDRLETLNMPLLSKQGKVLRNFTLIDQKTELKKKVRGYGQYGPTMTVEEFLDKEFEEGRVLQGGEEPVEEHDSDDNKWNDEQTYKAREWDEFKEANVKGSGNTINRG